MRILITGSNGLLGQKIVSQLKAKQAIFLATSLGDNRNSECNTKRYKSLDITNLNQVESVIDLFKPTHVINTAAITNVDFCEDNQDLCYKVNVKAVQNLFDVSKERGIQLIHLSTDFVFDGQNGPYREIDEPNPLSVYSKSKLDSELILMNSEYKNWTIIRTIIVYGEGENLSRSNIVLWAKSELKNYKKLTIVDDQFRSPTWAGDLAWACLQSAKLNKTGLFHISGPKTYSIYNLVIMIAEYYGFDISLVEPIKSETLNQKASRPPKTGFIIDKAIKELGYAPKSFLESLKYIN